MLTLTGCKPPVRCGNAKHGFVETIADASDMFIGQIHLDDDKDRLYSRDQCKSQLRVIQLEDDQDDIMIDTYKDFAYQEYFSPMIVVNGLLYCGEQ